jgi:hypothetical protein
MMFILAARSSCFSVRTIELRGSRVVLCKSLAGILYGESSGVIDRKAHVQVASVRTYNSYLEPIERVGNVLNLNALASHYRIMDGASTSPCKYLMLA